MATSCVKILIIIIIIIIIINIKFHKALTHPLYEFILHNNRKLVSALFQFIHTKVNYY